MADQIGRCWGCGYILAGLGEVRQCPECGRAFDPNDPATLNFHKPPGPIARLGLWPASWFTPVLAVVVVGLMGWGTGWPIGWKDGVSDRFMWTHWAPLKSHWLIASVRWKAFVLSLGAGALLSSWVFLRLACRLCVLFGYRASPQMRGRFWTWMVPTLMVLAAMLLAVLHGGARRLGREWAYTQVHQSNFASPGAIGEPQISDEQWMKTVRRLILDGDDVPQRGEGLIFLSSRPRPQQWPILLEAFAHEPDADLAAEEIHLICAYSLGDLEPLLMPWLNDPRPAVAAAAVDGVGIRYGPAFSRPQIEWYFPNHDLGIIGPVSIAFDRASVLRAEPATQPIEMPALLRDKIDQMMSSADDALVREAAARALILHPPAHYHLRIAEWGVWTAGENGRVDSLAAQAPSFVHKAGNPVSQMGDRIMPILISNKPVIFVTVDQRMAVDIDVRLEHGRPYLVYPMPDDFSVSVAQVTSNTSPPPPQFLKSLDPAGLTDLKDMRTGYPWLLPAHPIEGNISGGGFAANNISAMGVRWQSLIVSPRELPWMHEATLPTDPAIAWWKECREAGESWLASRGETERFLYYDGPTLIGAPVEVTFDAKQIHYANHHLTPPDLPDYHTQALVVSVDASGVRGEVNSDTQEHRISDLGDLPLAGPAVESKFLELLAGRGLTAREAAAMISTWRHDFFETPGKRVLLLMIPADYDYRCPMVVRPTPTEMVRVGVLVYELK